VDPARPVLNLAIGSRRSGHCRNPAEVGERPL